MRVLYCGVLSDVFEDEFLFGAGDDALGLGYHIGIDGDTGYTPFDELLGEFGIDGWSLPADGAGYVVFLASSYDTLDAGKDSRVTFVKTFLEFGIVAVDAEGELREIVAADGNSIDTECQEVFYEDDVGGDFDHHPDFEVGTGGEFLFVEEPEEVVEFINGANEGEHDPEVCESLFADVFDHVDFEVKEVGFLEVAGAATIADHGVFFVGFVGITTGEVAVFVGFEVGEAVDYRAWVECLGDAADIFSQFVDEDGFASFVEEFAGVFADVGNDEFGTEQADTVNGLCCNAGGE